MAAATTTEKLIARHGTTIARLDERDSLPADTTIEDFINLLNQLSNLFGTGSTPALQDASDELNSAAVLLTETLDLPDNDPAKAQLVGRADKHLINVDAIGL